MIEVRDLRKSYGPIEAVSGISFDVQEGEIFGLLGPNGAGKTTTISMLSGLLRPDGGEMLVGGHDPWSSAGAVRRLMAIVPQDLAIYEELTGAENLRFWGGLYDLSGDRLQTRVAAVLKAVGLEERAGSRASTYSGGMKRRLNLGMALLPEPKVLLLDEPTVGIDPQARLRIQTLVKSLAAGGMTVIYTTHYMEEAQDICRRIGIMDHGRILALGTLEELTRLVGKGDLVTVRGEFRLAELEAYMRRLQGLAILKGEDGLALMALDPSQSKVGALMEQLYNSELDIQDLSIKPPTLQDVFIKLTGRDLRD
ncbi:MAG: ATP-binding cassette domain-containing protein [Candidatus Eisenbacteria bacterium]|nr:ATP-binding cassette domain-containing protein [Candidatus Eisenbacteria bacterium]